MTTASEPNVPKQQVTFYVFFPGGGIGKYSHEVLATLQAREAGRLDLELVCLPEFAWLPEASYPTWPGLFSIRHAWPPLRKLRFLLAQVVNPRRLAQRARGSRSAWIHFCNINPLTYPLWRRAMRETGAKWAATVHDVRRAKGILHLGWELKQLARFYRECDALFVHSSKQADDLVSFAQVDRSRIHKVAHGPYAFVEDEALARLDRTALCRRYGLDPDRRVALFYGFLRDEKQLDVLLGAFAAGAEGWQLLVAGSGGAKGHRPVSFYADRIAALGLTDRVRLEGRYIPDGETPALFRMADCLALPYSTKFSSQSGVLNIAASYDTPVMATPCPSFTELLAECPIGHVCDGDDVRAVRRGLERLGALLDSGARFDFAGYRRAYGWDENAAVTAAAYLGESP
ncbi:MAG: glycosyltransferase family 4 protein [Planctomycetota bacterium]